MQVARRPDGRQTGRPQRLHGPVLELVGRVHDLLGPRQREVDPDADAEPSGAKSMRVGRPCWSDSSTMLAGTGQVRTRSSSPGASASTAVSSTAARVGLRRVHLRTRFDPSSPGYGGWVIPSAPSDVVAGRLQREFPVTDAAVAQARRWATATVTAGGHADLAPVVALLVSELASNVLLHAGGDRFSVEVVDAGVLEIRVGDADKTQPRLRAFTLGDSGGRGMALVDALADDWGVELGSRGKFVWFRVGTSAAGSAGTLLSSV